MFSLRDEADEDDDSPMGLGLPSFSGGKDAKTETKRHQPRTSSEEEEDDDDVEMAAPTKKQSETGGGYSDPFAQMRQAARVSLARHVPRGDDDTKSAAPTTPLVQCRVVEEKHNSGEPLAAVVFVLDMTDGGGKEQLELVESLIYGQPLNALVINRGQQDLHVIPFNTRLTCTGCAAPLVKRAYKTEVRHGVAGAGVYRCRAAFCGECGVTRASDCVLNGADLATEAKDHARSILDAIASSVMVPSKARSSNIDTAWKAATAVLQDLSHSVQNGKETFQPVRKLAIVCSRNQAIRGKQLTLTMPYRVDGGCLEVVPVIPVIVDRDSSSSSSSSKQTVEESLRQPFSVADAVVGMRVGQISETALELRERIEAYVRQSRLCVVVGAACNQNRWLRLPSFAPVLLLPWFSVIVFVANTDSMPRVTACDLPGVAADLKQRYQQDPDTDEDGELVDYSCLDQRSFRTAAAIEAGRLQDDNDSGARDAETNKDSNKTARSKDVTEEGVQRGKKRRKLEV